jgi:hypothetical protein
VKIFRTKYGMEISRPKYWSGNIQSTILAWKYSDQNFGVEIFRPKFWHENIQTKKLA